MKINKNKIEQNKQKKKKRQKKIIYPFIYFAVIFTEVKHKHQ